MRPGRPRVAEQHPVQPPEVRDVLVSAQHDVDIEGCERPQQVARVEHDVPLAARSRNRDEMVVDGEDADVVRLVELLRDPRVAVAPDPALVHIRLGRVEPDDREAGRPEALGPLGVERGAKARVRLAEQALEVDVADVPRVVVAGDDHLGELDLLDPTAPPPRTPTRSPAVVRSPASTTTSGSMRAPARSSRPSAPRAGSRARRSAGRRAARCAREARETRSRWSSKVKA